MMRRTFLATLALTLLLTGAARAEEEQAVPEAAATAAASGALKPGDVLGPDNWQLAEDLLPPEILDHYKKGEYINPIVDWPADYYVWPPDFVAGTEKNAGQLDVDALGSIVEKGSGKHPEHILGFPFPIIDPEDPKAASKILWNYYARTWYFGNAKNQSQLNWVNPGGLERRADVVASWRYYRGIPEYERIPNPQNFSSQFLTVVESPSDLSGTASLTWRYLDPEKRDSTWSFVPALRRVRAVSPANRSDGFLGSDQNQDDGNFFEGKPEDFTWKFKGSKEQLRLIDPLSLKRDYLEAVFLNEKDGWRANWSDLKFLGYMDKDWKGIAWAPLTGALAVRDHWVIEGVPNDRYYLYGKLELYIDKITYQGSWNRKFAWKGEILNTYQVMAFIPREVMRPDGLKQYIQGSQMAFQCAENVKANQATVTGIKSTPNSGFDSHVIFDKMFFETSSLSKYGK